MGGHYDFAFMTLTFYRIVQWKSVIKHQNILVRFHRHSSGIEKAGSQRFFPDPGIAQFFRFELPSTLVKGCWQKRSIGVSGIVTEPTACHMPGMSITESHRQCVVPYGGSVKTISALSPSPASTGNTSKASPRYKSQPLYGWWC